MSPQRSRNSRSKLELKNLLPCALTLATILLITQPKPSESTPNSRFSPATQQQADRLSDSNEPGQQENLPTPSAIEAIQNATTDENLLELMAHQTHTASPERSLSDLLTQQAASGSQQPGLLAASAQIDDVRPEASLAQSAAAGAVTGLRMAQDLIAQANMVEHSPYGEQEGDDQAMGAIDGTAVDEGGDDGQGNAFIERDQQNQPEDSSNAQDSQLKQASRRQMMANAQMRQAAESETQAADPMNENQIPDSIESLMGADLDDSDDSQAGEQSSTDEVAGQQQQQPASSMPPQLTRQMDPGPSAMPQEIDDDAENDNDNENPIERKDVSYAQGAKSPAMFEAPPVELAGGDLMSHFGGRQAFGAGAPELNHNLVAPMRDSLEDLNAAAGHYYGKKKKEKKVKKIIIKKKKKKKKSKKMKIKKIKVIKIKKMKKKGKKHYPKKHHHGHDHGKYYMYAKVPKKKAWEFGFKKGNKKHWISRHEKGYKNKFKTKVKWEDKKSKGKGFHVWDYNHHDKKKKGHH